MSADVDGSISPCADDVAGPGGAEGERPMWFTGRRFYLLAAVACLVIAGVVSLLASSQPDGLERVAEDTGFASSAQDSATSSSPLADYHVVVGDSDGSPLGTAAAGVIGVAITAAVAFGVFAVVGMGKRAPIKVATTAVATTEYGITRARDAASISPPPPGPPAPDAGPAHPRPGT